MKLSKIAVWAVLAALVVAFVGYLGGRLGVSGVTPQTAVADGLRLGDALFYFFALLMLVGALGVTFSRNILYSAIGLLMSLLGGGALYVFLSADFLAVAQLLVYIGGVLVLILFAVMLTSRISDINVSNRSLGLAGGAAVFFATAPVLLFVAVRTPWKVRQEIPALKPVTAAIGDAFLTSWLLPFEMASLVLLATLIGAVVVARKELKAD